MVAAACDEKTFLALLESIGPERTAERLGIGTRTVYRRRQDIERRTGAQIVVAAATKAAESTRTRTHRTPAPPWLRLNIQNGTALIGGDCHFWPGHISTTYKAFVRFCQRDKPAVIIMNGDVLDGAGISRHSPMQWETRPSLVEEVEECTARLKEIARANSKARKVWTLGNHDARFESRLATVAPEFAKIKGVHLKDHFPDWEPAMAVAINDDVVVKHRWHNGVHATYNNTLKSGKTMVTNHLHQHKVTPFSDYNGRRWGVDSGTLADPYGPQFEYTEWSPVNWWSGFAKLTFRDGQLLPPELIEYWAPNVVAYRGELIEVA